MRVLADRLYGLLLADRELGPLFAQTHIPSQSQRLAEYFIEVCGDTQSVAAAASVSAQRLRAAHASHHVTDRHFSIMASHLADLLSELEVDDDAAADLLDLVAARRADVVSASTVAGQWEPFDPTV